MVLYKAPDGTFRFPGSDDPNCRTAKQYKKLGYERIEAKGWTEVRRVEHQVNQQQGVEIRKRVERQIECREAEIKSRRSEVYNGIRNGCVIPEVDEKGNRTGRMKVVRLTESGKAVMYAAMERNDGKPRPREGGAGFHVEVYSQNKGNL